MYLLAFTNAIYHGMCCGAKVECHCATVGGWIAADVAVDVLALGTYRRKVQCY